MTANAPIALLDTSVAIDLRTSATQLDPGAYAIAAITLAELTAGPHAATNDIERASRQENLQWVVGEMQSLPFDDDAARAYGLVFAATLASGRKPRGPRAVDLLIAAVALANGLTLYTRNPGDFQHLAAVGLEVRAI